MATYTPPKRATAYTTYVSLVSQDDTDLFQTSVTLAAGDVTVSKDGGSFSNIATLPTEIGTSGVLEVALSGTEMTADTVVVRFRDAAGDEWCDALIVLHTSNNEIDDVATDLATVDANVDAILADTGTDGVVLADGAIAAAKIGSNAITAAKIATDAITAAKIATDAIGSDELAAAAATEIADAVLGRGVSNVEDSADGTSLAELLLAAFESKIASGTWTIYKTNHSDTFSTRTVTEDEDANPIVEVT